MTLEPDRMTQFERPDRNCPECASKKYLFRSRRTVTGREDEGGKKFVETKYICRECAHEWKERVTVPPVGSRTTA